MMTQKPILERYLKDHIPLATSLGLKVHCITEQELIVTAPFAPNINHKNTVFGGSLHAVATLACWGFIYCRLQPLIKSPEIVITKSAVSYLKPVTKDFQVSCPAPPQEKWDAFIHTFQKHKKARLTLTAQLIEDNQQCLDYQATFALFKSCSVNTHEEASHKI